MIFVWTLPMFSIIKSTHNSHVFLFVRLLRAINELRIMIERMRLKSAKSEKRFSERTAPKAEKQGERESDRGRRLLFVYLLEIDSKPITNKLLFFLSLPPPLHLPSLQKKLAIFFICLFIWIILPRSGVEGRFGCCVKLFFLSVTWSENDNVQIFMIFLTILLLTTTRTENY